MSMDTDATRRAEAYLCLGRAFLIPNGSGRLAALGEALPADLDELLGECPAAHAAIPRLRRAASHVGSEQALLRGYSALFLTPPYPVALNAGLHLDGVIMGPSVQQIRRLYQRYALDRAEGFRDLPDHLAAELEFTAYLWALLGGAATTTLPLEEIQRDLEGFLGHYVRRWLPSLSRSLKRALPEHDTAALYLALTEILGPLVDADLAALASEPPGRASATPEPPDPPANAGHGETTEAIRCAHCGDPIMADDSLREMMERLRCAGVSTQHLRLCPDCRGSAMGLKPLDPVQARRR